jgi:hypothetical protein
MNRPTAERVESVALVVILAVVAGSAGWASFTHVHDWTMRHVPDGTPDAFGWVNAIISELVPVAAFLVIRRRRRARQSIGYPVVLLIAGALLSLAAQLAVADKSPSGWLLSAVPALAFMALVKLVFTGNDTADVPATTEPAAPAPVTAEPVTAEPVTAEPVTAEPVTVEPATAESDAVPPVASPMVPAGFLPPPMTDLSPLNGHAFTSGGIR